MTVETIEQDFREKVCQKLRLNSEGVSRYRVFTPFMFEDGDHLSIVLRKKNGGWVLSDEGHTYMHLTYDLDEKDLLRGTRQKIISNALSMFSVQDREGELLIPIPDDQYGDALYSFIQALFKNYRFNLPFQGTGPFYLYGRLQGVYGRSCPGKPARV